MALVDHYGHVHLNLMILVIAAGFLIRDIYLIIDRRSIFLAGLIAFLGGHLWCGIRLLFILLLDLTSKRPLGRRLFWSSVTWCSDGSSRIWHQE
jgi:uncharacterized membrane protein YhhN